LGLTFIVLETTTKAAPDQSKTDGTEEEPKGKKEEELSTEERKETPLRRKRIFKPANKTQFHSAADTNRAPCRESRNGLAMVLRFHGRTSEACVTASSCPLAPRQNHDNTQS
jgi:hypothetical protein